MKYFYTDVNGIVISEIYSNTVVEGRIECPSEYEHINILGKRWNGSSFEEVPTEEVEVPETTEVTNADLLEVLLAIGEKVGA